MTAQASSNFPEALPDTATVGVLDGIGFPSPDFELPDQNGQPFRLRDHLAPGGTVVVFYRGHWCPYCRRYLCKLQSNLKRLQAIDAAIVAISPEPVATASSLATELQLDFPLLSDSDGRVINRYGTRNGFLGGGSVLPHPSVFVVDRLGVLRFRSIDRNYKKRTTIRSILSAIEAAQLAGADAALR